MATQGYPCTYKWRNCQICWIIITDSYICDGRLHNPIIWQYFYTICNFCIYINLSRETFWGNNYYTLCNSIKMLSKYKDVNDSARGLVFVVLILVQMLEYLKSFTIKPLKMSLCEVHTLRTPGDVKQTESEGIEHRTQRSHGTKSW